MVGISGNSGERARVPIPRPRSLPARMCGCDVVRLAIISEIRPATRSTTAGAPPLYGTWDTSTPATLAKSAIARCPAPPMPLEP